MEDAILKQGFGDPADVTRDDNEKYFTKLLSNFWLVRINTENCALHVHSTSIAIT